MTISSETSRVSYAGSGTTGPFAVSFVFDAASDLIVRKRNITTRAETLLVFGTDYSVTGGSWSTGSVTTTAAVSASEEIHIARRPALTQLTDILQNDPFAAETIERVFDRLAVQIQWLQDQINRSALIPFTAAAASGVIMPEPSAGALLGWAADGSRTLENKDNTGAIAYYGVTRWANAGGTADAITGTYSPAPTSLSNGDRFGIRATAANATTTPTFTPNSGTIPAKTIVNIDGSALAAGYIGGLGHDIALVYSSSLDKHILVNPILPAGAATTLGGFAASAFARLAVSNVFTAGQQIIAAAPGLTLYQSGGGVDQKRYILQADSDRLKLYLGNDMNTLFNVPVQVHRSGYVPTIVEFDIADLRMEPDPTSLDTNSVGFRGAPVVTLAGDHTLVLSNSGKTLYRTAVGTNTLTIPANASLAFPIGTKIELRNENGAGNWSVAITSDTLRWGSSTGTRTIAANGKAVLTKITATLWHIEGTGIS